MNEYVLGADIGSGSVKLTLLRRDGKIAGTAMCEYPTFYPQVGWCEQDPEDWCRAFATALGELKEKNRRNCRRNQGNCPRCGNPHRRAFRQGAKGPPQGNFVDGSAEQGRGSLLAPKPFGANCRRNP